MRILDEFKDKEFDDRNFPERPLQSGLVDSKTIITYGILNFILMTALSFASFCSTGIIFYFTSFFYSFLMFKEFFVKNFWELSPLLYLLSHQIVLVILYLSFSLTYFDQNQLLTVKFLVFFFYVYFPILLIELGRKIKHRRDKSGKKTNDTYAYVWGQRRTINLVYLIVSLCSIGALILNNIKLINFVVLNILSLSYLLFSFFAKEIFIEQSKILTYIISISMLVLIII